MVKLALFSWDQKVGSVLEFKYPDSFKLSSDLSNKIYMTHAYDQNLKNKELVEISFKNKKIISYCDKTKVAKFGYEILILVFGEQEKINFYKLKNKFSKFANILFNLPKEERKEYLNDNIDQFYIERKEKKVLLLGRAGTGKSTIKKIIFEGKDPKNLLYNSLEPTRGIDPKIYSWLDLQLGIFDSSGQELTFLLEQDNMEKQIAFENVDTVLYIFDFKLWKDHEKIIHKDIEDIKNIISKITSRANLVFLFHKIDLINKSERDQKIADIENNFRKKYNNQIFFTSIYPELIYNLYNAFYDILSNFSKRTKVLKRRIDKILGEFSKTMCFITDENNSIILQTMNRDFNTSIINHSHKLIAQLMQNFENMSNNNDIKHLILSGSNDINIILNNLGENKEHMRNLVSISESLNPNKLIFLSGKIKQKIISNILLNGG